VTCLGAAAGATVVYDPLILLDTRFANIDASPTQGVETLTQSFILLKSNFDPRQFWSGKAQTLLIHRTELHRLLGRDVSCCFKY